MSFFRTSLLWLAVLFLPGCTSYAVIENNPKTTPAKPAQTPYSIQSVLQAKQPGEITVALSFSGGGTRAAALAYGVLLELQDTPIQQEHATTLNLLDEVDVISAVSGGSFTAAYFGLKGQAGLPEFKQSMLLANMTDPLISEVLNPFNWFEDTGRTELAIKLYKRQIFGQATINDMQNPKRPLILINATDLGNGLRFSFTQDFFDYLCSDAGKFPLARAVAASSAVPFIFNPVAVKNYQPCPQATEAFSKRAQNNPELQHIFYGLKQYKTENYPYLQLVDGGLTDNLGLRAIYASIELAGGPSEFLQKVNKKRTHHLVVISVDASTQAPKKMRLSRQTPSLRETLSATTDTQIHRYNAATKNLFRESLQRWATAISQPQQRVQDHFIDINFSQLPSQTLRSEFNRIPTALTLTPDAVEKTIQAGRYLLKNHPKFQAVLQQLKPL